MLNHHGTQAILSGGLRETWWTSNTPTDFIKRRGGDLKKKRVSEVLKLSGQLCLNIYQQAGEELSRVQMGVMRG